MMHLSMVSLKRCQWWPDVYCIFRPDSFYLTDSFVSSSESGTQSSCYHLWTEAEYWWHLKLSTTALDRTCWLGLHSVLQPNSVNPFCIAADTRMVTCRLSTSQSWQGKTSHASQNQDWSWLHRKYHIIALWMSIIHQHSTCLWVTNFWWASCRQCLCEIICIPFWRFVP